MDTIKVGDNVVITLFKDKQKERCGIVLGINTNGIVKVKLDDGMGIVFINIDDCQKG